MSDLAFSTSRPADWEERCNAAGALFSSAAWLELLEQSFGCRTIYACNASTAYALTIFRGGPFSIGYLGFPVGGGVGTSAAAALFVDAVTRAKSRDFPTCVRIPVSAFDDQFHADLPVQENPETMIENLHDWQLESVSKRLRRDIRKAARSGLEIRTLTDAAAGDSLFEMYSRTVSRHGGALRYTADYFRALIELSARTSRLRVLIAAQGGEIAGFVAIARHGDTAYYLHGGAAEKHLKSSPSDLLLNQAIHDARDDGLGRFSLMASPPGQPSLVRYKEKWGGDTRSLRTYTIPLRPSYPVFRMVEKLLARLR